MRRVVFATRFESPKGWDNKGVTASKTRPAKLRGAFIAYNNAPGRVECKAGAPGRARIGARHFSGWIGMKNCDTHSEAEPLATGVDYQYRDTLGLSLHSI